MEINLETKRAWRQGDTDRRINKEARRNMAEAMRRGKELESRLIVTESEGEYNAITLAVCLLLAMLMISACLMKGGHL